MSKIKTLLTNTRRKPSVKSKTMDQNKTLALSALKKLILFATFFLAYASFGQSLSVKHYENGNLMVPSFFTNNSPRLCANDSVQLEASGFTGTLSWSGPSGAITSTSATIWVSEQGSYSVGDGVNSESVYIGFDSDNPEIYSDDYPTTSSTNGGIGSTSNASSPSGGLFGILNPSEEYLAPFGAEYANNKQQYLYRASELTDLGLAQGSTLKEIGFYLNASWNSNCNTQVELRVYQTTSTSMTGFETSNSDYLGSWNCMDYQSGWNYFDINDIDWDGAENLVFEFCYNTWGGNSPQNPSIALDNVGFDASVVVANPNNSQCTTTGGFVVNDYRPSTSFKYSNAARKDTIVLCGSASTLRLTSSAANYTWSSANSTYSGTTNELNVSSDDLVYITGYTNQFCKYDDTVRIYSASESVPTITASSTDFCEGDTETLTVTLTSNQSARWSTGESSAQISIVDGGAYTVTVSNEFGCSMSSAALDINMVSFPEIYLSENGFEVLTQDTHEIGGYSFKKLVEDPSGTLYFFSDQGIDISSLGQILYGTAAVPTSIDNANEDALIHNAQNQYHNSNGGVYMLAVSGRYNHSDASVSWDNGSTSTYTNWDLNNLYSSGDNKYISKYYYNDKWEANGATYDLALIEYNSNSLKLLSGSTYCDSVQLFAPSIFDTYLWSSGETTKSIWVSGNGSHTISVTGTYTKSDGTTCSLTSDNYTFTINDAPALSITNLSGTSDLTGSNHIEIEADYTSGATIQWSTGSTNDSIHIYSTGEYTATATLNGCSVSKSFTAYQPMYVDATNGDDANGTGTLSDPYKTINKGISESQSRGKVYVLPGTYNETLNITKNVFIASDYFRLGNTNAVNTTIINGQGLRRLVNYDNTTEPLDSAASKIVGFTMKGGFQDSDDGAGIYGGWNVTGNTQIKNSVIEQTSRKCCANGIVLSWFSSGEIILDSVYVDDIGNSGDGDQRISFAVPYGKLTILNSRISNVLQDNSLFNISNSAELYIENTHITGISDRYNNNGVVLYLNNSAKAYFNHVTIDDIDLSDDRYVFRIGSGSYSTLHFVNSVVDETFGRFIMDQSSSNATIEIVNSVVGNAESGYSGSYSSNTPALTNTGELNNYSGAIGLARSTVNVSGKIYKSPPMDLLGGARPNPTGSNPDAGAYENAKSQGDFAAQTTSCGYLISAQVFNSDNYSVEWIQNGTVLGTDDDYLASSKGTYTLKVYSVDRLDTITKTVALNNPLNMEILDVSNSCEFISSNNGRVSWGNISGGTPYSSDWWTYRTAVRNESGSQIDGYWDLNNPQDYVGTKSNLAPGKYYFFIDDATGCEVGDTVEILEQVQSTYYVSTTGDNSNDGLSETDPFATISRAVSSTCKGDTVIVLDGTYFEDSITINSSVVIGSKYLIDGDTNHFHNTIIDGGSSAYVFDYPYSQTSSNWADTTYNRIEALTIQNGMVVNNDRGGALTLANERTLLIDGVQFKSNSAQRGGAVLQREWSRMALKNSTFTGNEASNDGGGFYSSDGYLVLTDNHFQNNSTSYHGGAMYLHSPRSLVMNNIDMVSNQANDGASGFFASLCCVGSSIDITNIRVLNGSGQTPILIHQSQSYWITFKNLLIAGNSSTQAEAMQIQDGSSKIRLVNSTIVNNNLTNGSTGFLKCDWGDVDLVIWNSILDANDATAILYDNTCDNYNLTIANSFVNLPSSSLYDNNCGTTNITYSSNITTGSYYEDIANGNYAPSSVSSVLGAGSSTATVAGASLSAPATDLLGNTRPSPTGTSPDLGAIESIESAPQLGMTSVVEHNGFCETNSGSITVNLLNYSGTASYQWKSITDANWSWNSTQTASNLADGTYRAIASDNSTQAKLDSIDVTIVTLPSITISNLSSNANCNGDSDGELAFAIEGGNPFGTSQYAYSITFLETESAADGYVWNDGSYYFSSNSNSSPRSNTFSSNNWAEDFRNGYYEVVVTDEDGCSVTDTLLLDFDHELPAVSITTLSSDGVSGLTSMCLGIGNTIDLTADVTGGGGTNSYSWSNSSTAQTVGVAQTGSYEVEVSDQFGCIGRDTIDIYFQDAPQLIIEGVPAKYTGEQLTSNNITNSTYLGEFEGHHYYMVQQYYSWTQARIISEEVGGHMWIPNSATENSYVWDLAENAGVNSNAHIGIYWNGSQWVGVDEQPLTYSNWRSSLDQPYSDYAYATHDYWGDEWHNNMNYSNYWIIEFAPESVDLIVGYNQNFCDSIELKATPLKSSDAQGFTEVYWTDANTGDTLNIGEYGVFTDGQEIILKGEFVRSDGSTCLMSSSTNKFGVFGSPAVSFTTIDSINGQVYSGVEVNVCDDTELYVSAIGSSDTSNSFTYLWADGSTDSIVSMLSSSTSSVTITDVLGCSTESSITVFKKPSPEIAYQAIVLDSLAYSAPYIPNFYYQGTIGDKYIYSSNYSTTWSQARQDAIALGGDLASFSTEDEYNTLKSWAWNEKIVGLNDSVSEGVWEFSDGTPVTYYPPNWGQGEPSNSGNGEDYITISNYSFNDIDEFSQYEFLMQVPVPPTELPLASGEQFCDSITLFALGFDESNSTQSFSKIYWKDELGNVLDSSKTLTVESTSNIILEGFFMQSNGSECSMFSDTIEVIINETPDLVVYSADSTYEMTGDSLILVAYSNSSSASLTWLSDTLTISNDTTVVYDRGSYVATVTENGCSISKEVLVDQPIFVAKIGSNITGTGSLTKPYKTIQFAIDTANSGQKIYVLPGTYNENIVIDKQIRLLSDFVRLDNSNAKSTTIINAGFSGRAIEFSNSTRIDLDSTIIDGFTIKNGDANGDEGSGIYANWNQGSGLTINNSIISNHRKQCCSDGIAMNIQGVDLYLNNVDILDNGSPVYWDERQVLSLRHLTSVWNEVRFNGNESNNSLIYLYETDLTINNSEFIGNTIQDNNQALIGADWNSDVVLNHVTMTNNIGQGYGIKVENNQDQKVVVYNSAIDGFAQGGIKTAGSNNEVYLINSIINSIPQAISGNGNVTSVNTLEITSLELNTNGTLKQTSPAIGLGGADTTVAGYRLSSPAFDLAGAMRPNPAGSRPDAGAYEDSLARGLFGLEVSNCGYSINAKVLNSDAYSITISSSNGFYSTNSDVEVSLKGSYTIAAFDSVSSQIISKTVAITNPLSVDYIFGRDACASNGGFGEIIVGEFTGGTQYNIPNNSWFDYYLSINDSSGSNIYNQEVSDDNGSRWNTNVQAGVYTIGLSDASGCTVYDTVEIDDLIGSKYYISTTGSDAASGSYTEPLSTITEAITRACDGDTIVLFDGEYFENVEIKNSTMPYVIIASEFIEDGDDDHIAATKVNGMDEDPVFDVRDHSNTSEYIHFVGFTITNGKSNSNWYGGGGISAQNSHISLDHMVVSGNRSGNSGGGIGIDNGKLQLSNTVVENNLASNDGGGIYLTAVGEVNAIGSVVIRNNKANSSGGGISWNGHWGTELSLSGMTIENNESQYDGGGLYAGNGWGNNGASVTLENLIIRNNRSINGTGGAFINGSGNDVTLQNAIITYNKSNSTGGLQIENADIDVIHTTIYKNGVLNSTSSNDQILLRNNANVVFLNSAVGGQEVIGASSAHTFYIDDFDVTCDLTIESSIISGGTTSIDNPYSSTITGTPIGQALYLSDPANGDYMLSPVSQGLGAGTTSYSGTTIPLIDIIGNIRPGTVGQNPDVGAVESPLDSATFGAAYEIRNNISCDNTYGRLKVIPLNGSGAYKFELDDLTGTATFTDQQNVSSYTYSSLYSGDYFVTITDIGTTPNSVFTDTVSVKGKDSLQLIKDVTNEFCFGESNGSISLNVFGGDGFYDYTWSTATNSAYPKTSVLNNLSPEEYFVTVKDGDNCFVEDSVTIITLHSLPSVVITGEITKGSTTTTTTNPQIRACAGDEVTLNAGSGFVSYNWTTVDGLNNWTTQTLPASYEQGFYLTAVDAFGCSNSDSAEVFYVQTPAIYASNVNTNIGASMQSVTSYVEGTSQRIGNNYNDAKPYGAGDNYAKMQFIIPASELIAEGLTDQTTINSIGFEVEVESGSPVQSFKIKMKNTSSNQVSSTFESGLTKVYDLNILTPGEGWNTHVLDNGFNWDGTKNLLVQVEYSNVAFSNGSDNILMGADYSYSASTIATGMSSVASSSNANYTSTWRPNMKFGIDKVQATDTLRVCDFTMLNTTDDYDTYSWLVGSTTMGSALRYSVNSPVEVVLKTVDAASSCTMYSDTVQVLLDTTPSVFVTAPNLLGCVGDTLYSSIDTVQQGIEYSWSNGLADTIAAFSTSGQYYVFAMSPSGCQGVDTVDVSINIPPDVVVELNGKVLTSTDGSLVADNSACDTTLILPYLSAVDTLSMLNSSEWTTYSTEYLDWEFQNGWDSLVDFTGPMYDADNNTAGGFYQFDPASLTDQNKVGYLQLGCVNLLGMSSPELNFAYHMVDMYADSANTADQMGTMSLEVKTPSDMSWTTLWQRSGTDSSYAWVDKSVDLSAYANKTIQLRWKGQAGVGGPRSEMGLDNISLNDSLALLSNVAGRITPETVCEGDSISANTISNGTANFSFLWNTGDTTSAVELHNTGWYSVSVRDEKNCLVTSDSVYIEVNPAPMQQLVLSDTTQYCESLFDSLTITANSTYATYQWYANYNNEGFTEVDTTNEIMLDSIALGLQKFYVMITDSLGCRSTSDVVELIETSAPSLVLSSNDVLCNSDSTGQAGVVATGSGAWGYLWSNGDTASESLGLPTGYYAVTVTDTFSCVTMDSIFVGEPTAISLSVVSSIDVDCFGSNSGSADIDFTGGVGGYNFTWTDSTGTWSSANEDLASAPASEYYVVAQDSNGCSLVDTISIEQPTELFFTIDSVLDLSCKGALDGYLSVSATGGALPYQFIANGDTNVIGEFFNLDSSLYTLSVLDANGCIVMDSTVLSQPDPPFNGEEICVVTVDTTGKNLLVWEKTPAMRTATYIVLKENTSTQYVGIGLSAYADMSTFVDTNSNPAVQPYRYRLALIDSCGFISDTSDYHATIHLQASPGVASNEVQLQWTAYEGKTVQTYYIYRWLSPTQRVLVDSVSSNVQTYTDIYPVTTTITALLYEVGAKFVDGVCSPTAGKNSNYVNSLSNRLDWGTDSGLPIGTEEWVNVVLENDLEIYPNPSRGSLNVTMTGAWEQEENVKLKVMDMTGRTLAKRTIERGGSVSFDFSELPAGVYFLHTITNDGRIVVKRFERIN